MNRLFSLATISLFIANILYWYEVVFLPYFKFLVGGRFGNTTVGENLLSIGLLIFFIFLGIALLIMSIIVLSKVYDYDY